ncbi:DUF2459 domain-containing protein [Microseira wollei]|uniref:TIGR02117 family protein n=1 Tax=Microseira wollei NIES-4236 TaxID=2530354 RepID=A0AAV3XPD4_9CYAN|nr:DUF2459 domain-containing protein [Microseira wollei]GET43471.1 hypothetical protein MiSe_82950 [Microseira wollei NIES-4236]
MRKIKFSYFFTVPIFIFSALLIGALMPQKSKPSPASCDVKICVINFGFHSEIVVPVQNKIFDWRKHLSFNQIGAGKNADYNYLGFGWGEREFYMNPPREIDAKIAAGIKALFLPNPSVIRVEGYKNLPQNFEIECLGVSQSGYLKLNKFIRDTFQLNRQGEKNRFPYGVRQNVSYYEAKGTYSILRNCNSWTAEALRKADVNTPVWAGLSTAIMLHLDNSCDGEK